MPRGGDGVLERTLDGDLGALWRSCASNLGAPIVALAEVVVSLREKAADVAQFEALLKENGVEASRGCGRTRGKGSHGKELSSAFVLVEGPTPFYVHPPSGSRSSIALLLCMGAPTPPVIQFT